MTDCVRITDCRLCDSTNLDLIVSFTPTPPGDQYLTAPKPQPCYPLDLLVCRDCGAVQLADTVNPDLIYPDYIYTTSISKGLDAHFSMYADQVLTRVRPARGALAVDIGSNDGTLLRHFKARGCTVFGVDPATAIAKRATESGIPTECAFFSKATASDLRHQYGSADIITANHIMANVADLHDFADGIKALLAPDGTFVFETGYWPAIMKGMLIDTIEHEHIHYFAVGPLVQFFQRHGLQLVHVEPQPTKGGSLRGYVKHAGAPVDSSVRRMSGHEARTGYTDPKVYTDWVRWIEKLKTRIAEDIAAKGDQQWVGYGSAVGSTLLLHHFGLGNALNELWDDNASRHGRVSPGFHVPVVAPNTSTPDKIVLLAWRYADRIMDQHPEHRGKWMIPLPVLRVA